jgi:hypothetical protein
MGLRLQHKKAPGMNCLELEWLKFFVGSHLHVSRIET